MKCGFGIGYGIGRKYRPIWVSVSVSDLNQNSGLGRTLQAGLLAALRLSFVCKRWNCFDYGEILLACCEKCNFVTNTACIFFSKLVGRIVFLFLKIVFIFIQLIILKSISFLTVFQINNGFFFTRLNDLYPVPAYSDKLSTVQ